MKITLGEYDGAFHIDMEAETVQDAALLTRLKLNALANPPEISCFANRSGGVSLNLAIASRAIPTSFIPKGER